MGETYAIDTKVPIGRSQDEIKKLLSKHGATSFAFAESKENAMLMFELQRRRICFRLPMPNPPSPHATQASMRAHEQLCRTRWRALVLAIKAKLTSVASKITTIEQEFLAHIVMPDGKTVGEHVTPRIQQAYETNTMPPLLGGSH